MAHVLVASYNIHKGVLGLRSRKLTIHALKERIHYLNPDLMFLQEVQGLHHGHAQRFVHWPRESQHEFLSRPDLTAKTQHSHYYSAYGLNAFYRHGHHGNALLSKYPIAWRINRDVSDHRFEQRGILHCLIQTPTQPIHALVVHFGLFAGGRQRQMHMLIDHVHQTVPVDSALIIAGDFNDWQGALSKPICHQLNVMEVFESVTNGALGAKSFPVKRPFLRLDRMYQRGFEVKQAQVLTGPLWMELSDHAPIVVTLDWAAGS